MRYFNVYGNRQPISGSYALVIGKFINQILNNAPLTINGDGEQRRDFVCVEDVVEANMICSSIKHNKDNILNIGSGVNYSINELADLLCVSYPKLNNPPVIEPKETLANIRRAKSIINWEPKINFTSWLSSYKKELKI